MLRQNVLVDCGKSVARWDDSIIECPEAYKQVNVRGKLVSVSDNCVLFNKKDIGKEVVVSPMQDFSRRLDQNFSKSLGLDPHWHVIISEKKVVFAIE
jgi:hypothetical protein